VENMVTIENEVTVKSNTVNCNRKLTGADAPWMLLKCEEWGELACFLAMYMRTIYTKIKQVKKYNKVQTAQWKRVDNYAHTTVRHTAYEKDTGNTGIRKCQAQISKRTCGKHHGCSLKEIRLTKL
jgi:hypothetical protein